MPDTAAELDPVVRRTVVHCGRQHAWDTFVALGGWWPVVDHSIDSSRTEAVVLEPAEGGRVFERWDDGSEHDWGRVLAWEPPGRLVLAWHPGRPADLATEVEVRFVEERAGFTRVVLEHRGWARLGSEAAEARESYDAGWLPILTTFKRSADDPEIHRVFGISLNNAVWGALGRDDRTPDDDARMVDAAHASLWHWSQVGTEVNLARGEWLCAHVYTVLGRVEPALHHARRSMTEVEAAGLADFDLVYGYEGMARALALAGAVDEARVWLDKARAAAELVSEPEDRAIVDADLTAGPWYALA